MRTSTATLSRWATRALVSAATLGVCTQAFAAKSSIAILNATEPQGVVFQWLPPEPGAPDYTLTLTPFSTKRGLTFGKQTFRSSVHDSQCVPLSPSDWLLCEVESEAGELPPIKLVWGIRTKGGDQPYYMKSFTLTLTDWPALKPVLSKPVAEVQEMIGLEGTSKVIPEALKTLKVGQWFVLKHRGKQVEDTLEYLKIQDLLRSEKGVTPAPDGFEGKAERPPLDSDADA